MICLNMPSNVVSTRIGVGTEGAGRDTVPRADVLIHEPVQLYQARDQHWKSQLGYTTTIFST